MKKFNVGDLVEISASGELEEFDGLRLFVAGYYQSLPVISFYTGVYAEYQAVCDAYSCTSDPEIRRSLFEDMCSLSKKFLFFNEENLILIRPANDTKEQQMQESQETLYLLSSEANAKRLMEPIAQIREGKAEVKELVRSEESVANQAKLRMAQEINK